MKQKIIDNKLTIILFIIFQVFTIITCLYHEPWFDEAQAWNIAKLDLAGIIERLPYEQHPILWFLVLKFFQILGLKYEYIWVISYLFVTFAILFILFKTNIDKKIKLIICFCGPLIYYFPVISREYCLMPLLFVALGYLYDKKIKYSYLYSVCLVLLANTMILVEMFIFLFGCQLIYDLIKQKETKKAIINLIILTLGAFSVIIPVLSGLSHYPHATYLGLSTINEYILHFVTSLPITILLYLYSCKVLKGTNKLNKIFGKISIFYLLFILEFIYGMIHEQKFFIIFLILIFFYIISNETERKQMNKKFITVMIFSGCLAYFFSINDIINDYSDSVYIKNMAIKNSDAIFITNGDDTNVTLSPYNLKNVVNYKNERPEIILEHTRGDLTPQMDYETFKKNLDKYDCDVYVLYTESPNVSNFNFDDFDLIRYDLSTINQRIVILKYKK